MLKDDEGQALEEETSTGGVNPTGQGPTGEVDALLREVQQLRREAAGWRTKLRKAEEADEQRKREEMTELQRVQADLAAERQARANAEEKHRAEPLRYLGNEVALGEDGTAEGLDAALDALVKARPYLVAKATGGTIPPTNPAAGGLQRPSDEQLRRDLLGGGQRTALFEGGGVFSPS